MQASLKAVVLACALALSTLSYGFDCCGFLGIGSEPCGCGNPNCCDGCEPDRWGDAGCGCEADCGCEPTCGAGCGDCCEASCGCSEASCGCSGAYCVDGRKFAGRTYNCGCESYMPMQACTGPECCEPACGCGCGDSCEAGCGCEPSCGCGDCCEPSCGCGSKPEASCCSGLFSTCGRMCSALCGGGSCGCSGEVYWSEWHNDPPRCCDPCNRSGQWIGPSAGGSGCGCGDGCNSCDSCGPSGCGCNGGYGGGYGGQVDDGYGVDGYYSSNRPTRAHGGTTFAAGQQPKRTSTGPAVARTTPNPYTKARTARKPQQGAKQQVQR